jgi:hypothetical protein
VVIDRVRRGAADLSGVEPRLRPLLAAALAPDPAARPEAAEVLASLERFAGGGEATVVVPINGAGALVGPLPTRPYDAAPPEPVPSLSPTRLAPAYVPPSHPAPPDPLGLFGPSTPAQGSVLPAAPEARPARTGTLLAVLVALVACSAAWPTVTAAVAAALLVLARFAHHSASAWSRRRTVSGRRGTDPYVAAVASPWHLVLALLFGLPALVLPVVLGLSATFIAGFVQGQVGRAGAHPITPGSSIALAAGLLVGLLAAWWGPGGMAVRGGSAALVRGLVRGPSMTSVVVTLLLLGAVAALWIAYSRGAPEFWPLHQLPYGLRVR